MTGTIEDPVSAPVAGVAVTLISLDHVLRTKSAANGAFAFEDVPTGKYDIEIAAPGFAKQRLSFDLEDKTARLPLSVVLRAGIQPDPELCGSHCSITYGPLGSANRRLSGIVRHYERPYKGVRNAEVTVCRTNDQRVIFRSYSDEAGRFAFENIPAGDYYVRIAKPGYLSTEVKRLVKPRQNEVVIDATILEQNKMIACQ